MGVPLDHRLRFPSAQTLQLECRCSRLAMPSREGVPQVMPPEILNSGPLQCIAPRLGIDLDNWISLVAENMGRVIALPTLQHIHGSLIERYRMRSAVFVISCRHPQMAAFQADLFPMQPGNVGLPETRCNGKLGR